MVLEVVNTKAPKDQTLRTPPALCLELQKRFAGEGFTLDAAADGHNALADCYYTEEDDALTQPWEGRVFVNPPYADMEPWVRKAWHAVHVEKTAEVVVMLFPNRRSAEWWHRWVKDKAWHIEDIEGRVHFYGPDGPLKQPFEPSVVVVYRRPLVASEHR